MQRRRARDAHFRRHFGVGFEKLEMLQHRVTGGEAELAFDANAFHPALHAVKLDAVVERVALHAVKQAVEVEVPPRAAEFAVGRDFQPDVFLLLDDLLDLAVLDLRELCLRDLALLAFGAGLFQRCGTQDRADDIGAERGFLSHHRRFSSNFLDRNKPGPRASSTAKLSKLARLEWAAVPQRDLCLPLF